VTVIEPVVPLDGLDQWRDILGQVRYYPNEDWRLNLYALGRRDRSTRGRHSRYYGLSSSGRVDDMKVWMEGALLRGEDKGRPQRAHAIDLGASYRFSSSGLRPYATLGLAIGTGDRSGTDATSEEFRQSGYDDNSSRTWGVTNFKHYGEALDPELTNLRVLTAAVGFRPVRWMSVDLVAHDYRQDRLDDELGSTDLRIQDDVLTGSDRHVGNALDLVLGARDILGRVNLGYRVGIFRPGSAFQDRVDVVVLQRLEARFEF